MIDPSSPMRRLMPRIIVAALVLITGSVSAQGGGPVPARNPLAENGRMALSPTDRCPVCAMFPARTARSAAAMTLKDGTTYYFCSNGCLLRTWLRPMVYLGRSTEAIDRLAVQDYFSGRPVNARTATWIAGSDVIGPMGPAIVALGDATQQDAFIRRHGGTAVFTFDQIDDRLWRRISHRQLPAKQQP